MATRSPQGEGANPIQDLAGNDADRPRAPGEGGDIVQVRDITPPVLLSATLETLDTDQVIVLQYNEPLLEGNPPYVMMPDPGCFQLGGDAGGNEVVEVCVVEDTVRLFLESPQSPGDVITITYTAPDENPIRDENYNVADSFYNVFVYNNLK